MDSGFAIVPGVLDSREVDAVLHELESEALPRSRAGARHLISVPVVAALAKDPRLISLAAEVLGSEPLPFGATLFDAQIHDAVHSIEPAICTVERGGVIVMQPLTVHASSKVTAAASRRVLHFEYAAATFDEGPRLRVP